MGSGVRRGFGGLPRRAPPGCSLSLARSATWGPRNPTGSVPRRCGPVGRIGRSMDTRWTSRSTRPTAGISAHPVTTTRENRAVACACDTAPRANPRAPGAGAAVARGTIRAGRATPRRGAGCDAPCPHTGGPNPHNPHTTELLELARTRVGARHARVAAVHRRAVDGRTVHPAAVRHRAVRARARRAPLARRRREAELRGRRGELGPRVAAWPRGTGHGTERSDRERESACPALQRRAHSPAPAAPRGGPRAAACGERCVESRRPWRGAVRSRRCRCSASSRTAHREGIRASPARAPLCTTRRVAPSARSARSWAR